MGPYFVYVVYKSLAVAQVYPFASAMEARAFYYGMREMLRRAKDRVNADNDTDMTIIGGRPYSAREYRRYFGMLQVKAMAMDIGEECADGSDAPFYHSTIYDKYYSKDDMLRSIEVAISDMEASV